LLDEGRSGGRRARGRVGRVGFYRHPQNCGATRNFNTCIRRSLGHWVHILHGDDLVQWDFYETMRDHARRFPQAAILAARCFVVNETDSVMCLSPRVSEMETPTRDPSPLLVENKLRTPGVVVRRDFYEKHGGFREELVHTADWEMWCRAFALGGGLMLDQALARYREFAQNDTSRLARTGENLRDYLRTGEVFSQAYPYFDRDRFLLMVRCVAAGQLERFRRLGDAEAVQANQELCRQLGKMKLSSRRRIREFVKSIPIVRDIARSVYRRLLSLRLDRGGQVAT